MNVTYEIVSYTVPEIINDTTAIVHVATSQLVVAVANPNVTYYSF